MKEVQGDNKNQAPMYNVLIWLNEKVADNDEKALRFYKAIEPSHDWNILNDVLEWMIELAEQGDVDAQYNLGLHYKQTPNGDDKEAVKWFTKAANKGHILSCWNLGMYYEYGLGDIEKDVDKAIEWYTKVANSDENYAIDAELKLQKFKDSKENN